MKLARGFKYIVTPAATSKQGRPNSTIVSTFFTTHRFLTKAKVPTRFFLNDEMSPKNHVVSKNIKRHLQVHKRSQPKFVSPSSKIFYIFSNPYEKKIEKKNSTRRWANRVGKISFTRSSDFPLSSCYAQLLRNRFIFHAFLRLLESNAKWQWVNECVLKRSTKYVLQADTVQKDQRERPRNGEQVLSNVVCEVKQKLRNCSCNKSSKH